MHRIASHEDGSWIGSASRMAPAAFWVSWADALHMIDQRLPRVSRTIVGRLTGGDAQGCLGALVRATEILDRDCFMMRPPWEEFQGGKRPPSSENAEPGEWQHGWQRVFHFRVPLSGDRGHCPVMLRRPGPLAFSLRTLHQRRVARSSDRPGVQGHPGTFPHAGSGEVAFAIANREGSVRVWCFSGRARSPSSSLP